MIIHGQDHPGSDVASLLLSLSEDERIILFAERILS